MFASRDFYIGLNGFLCIILLFRLFRLQFLYASCCGEELQLGGVAFEQVAADKLCVSELCGIKLC